MVEHPILEMRHSWAFYQCQDGHSNSEESLIRLKQGERKYFMQREWVLS